MSRFRQRRKIYSSTVNYTIFDYKFFDENVNGPGLYTYKPNDLHISNASSFSLRLYGSPFGNNTWLTDIRVKSWKTASSTFNIIRNNLVSVKANILTTCSKSQYSELARTHILGVHAKIKNKIKIEYSGMKRNLFYLYCYAIKSK